MSNGIKHETAEAIRAPMGNSLSPEPCALIPSSFQDQVDNLTVGAPCSCGGDTRAAGYAFLGLEPIA